jgi:hypothetical protein
MSPNMKPRIYIPLLLLAYVLLRRALFPRPHAVRCDGGMEEWIDRIELDTLMSDRSADA